MPLLAIDNLKKYYGDQLILQNINLEVDKGEVISILGQSGSGKSTLLRCINALEDIQEGHIYLNGKEIHEDAKDLSRLRQKIGMVFQSYELFPHLSVLDNITIAPRKVLNRNKEEAE